MRSGALVVKGALLAAAAGRAKAKAVLRFRGGGVLTFFMDLCTVIRCRAVILVDASAACSHGTDGRLR